MCFISQSESITFEAALELNFSVNLRFSRQLLLKKRKCEVKT